MDYHGSEEKFKDFLVKVGVQPSSLKPKKRFI